MALNILLHLIARRENTFSCFSFTNSPPSFHYTSSHVLSLILCAYCQRASPSRVKFNQHTPAPWEDSKIEHFVSHLLRFESLNDAQAWALGHILFCYFWVVCIATILQKQTTFQYRLLRDTVSHCYSAATSPHLRVLHPSFRWNDHFFSNSTHCYCCENQNFKYHFAC